ncbi:1,4-alpha-glucan branching protein GlgB [Roseicitreum antarcticum]|uniref:1,4-alpha-glucan branching enzyme GlgB n=1 Tax=Roseicitreum antarcticum TaxID=564137 RepID=A0A1H2W2H6_9RHOB|nr:1,4-alpha-glucan branching protein GlgB [Roseicitreum antarcticum]SDW74289.1 1,4-alpha-glucan branching enzyme [Roseicitreum antarcticum]
MRRPQAKTAVPTDPPFAPETDSAALEALVTGNHGDPFSILGVHPCDGALSIRVFAPGATSVAIEDDSGTRQQLTKLHDEGAFGRIVTERPARYSVIARNDTAEWRFTDPYQFGPVLGSMDEHLISEGAHMRLWRTLGAHPMTHEGVDGVTFAVWAPAARRVSVIGDFNDWDGRKHPMRRRGATGVWELFIPELGTGARYKYEVLGMAGGLPTPKSDPVGFQGDLRPDNCSIVQTLDDYKWRDGDWMRDRGAFQRTDAPISIYEAHLGSWRKNADGTWLSYRELAETLVPYVKDLGFTHIECLPVSEHPFDGSWGYQPVGLYAPTSRFGQLDDFRAFVDACHAAGLGLILDWVPAHFPTDTHGLAEFDGTALYEHEDPREGFHPDWNTLIYNFGRQEVSNFLIANALYWTREHHIDGLRVDAVASMLYRDYSRKDGEWIPNRHGGRENLESIDFLRRLNSTVYGDDPSAMVIAEESTAWPGVSRAVHDGGLGFGFKWNMGWMHDTLEYMAQDPAHRAHHHSKMSFGLNYAFSENFILSLSHDEVVHGKGSMFGKMPGDADAKMANLRAYYAFMWAHPGKKLLFMGQEFGQRTEWNADAELDWRALQDPAHAGLSRLVRDLNSVYRGWPALHARDCRADGFEWIDGAAEAASVYAWIRHGEDGAAPVLAVFNFSGVAHTDWRLGVPQPGFWREILNTDAEVYSGGGRGNLGGVTSAPQPSHGHAHSVSLTLPPLSGTYLTLEAA